MGYHESELGYVKKEREYTNVVNYESYYVHKHSFWEFFMITKGTTKHYFNDNESTLKAGDVVLIHPGNDYHYFKDSSVPDYEHRDLYATVNVFQSVCDLISPDLYQSLLIKKEMMIIHVSDEELSYLTEKFEELNSFQLSNGEKSINYLYIPLVALLLGLFVKKYFVNTNEQDREFNEFIAKINSPKFICGTIGDIVRESGYSHGYLCRLFKEKMGENLKTYHVKLKMDYATYLLMHTDNSILSISSTLGYASLSNFIHVFRLYVGYTPSKYRAKMKKNKNVKG